MNDDIKTMSNLTISNFPGDETLRLHNQYQYQMINEDCTIKIDLSTPTFSKIQNIENSSLVPFSRFEAGEVKKFDAPKVNVLTRAQNP